MLLIQTLVRVRRNIGVSNGFISTACPTRLIKLKITRFNHMSYRKCAERALNLTTGDKEGNIIHS
jgi:hypothetical protein